MAPRSTDTPRGLRVVAIALVAHGLILLCTVSSAEASTHMITTTYAYNADGAPTAVTTQVGDQPATTIYFTWDNFTPDPDAPTTGTVSAADGNLLGIGASPGNAGIAQYSYDVRDRLIGCGAAGQSAASYAYHPTSLLASSTPASGGALQFYYDDATAPRMINTTQASAGLTASFLGPVRYVSDGTEQVLLNPRKDVAGIYDATEQTLSSYAYEPYGASMVLGPRAAGPHARGEDLRAGRPRSQEGYDLTDNPFQYAGEYRDPICDAYYLRARWYLPAPQTFLSRDWGDRMHRYSYTGGNPVGRVDPSGLSYEGFSRSVNHLLRPINHGVLGVTLPWIPIYGQVVGGMTLMANLPQFWHHPTTPTWINYGFLLASVAVEGFDAHPYFDAGGVNGFHDRILADAMIGAGQAGLAGERGHGKWDVDATIRSAEYSFSGIVSGRVIEGFGYRPFSETTDEVSSRAEQFFAGGTHRGEMLVYRVSVEDGAWGTRWTSPLREWRTIGGYHESIVAVGADWSVSTEVYAEDMGSFVRGRILTRWNDRTDQSPLPYMRDKEMQFVGSYATADVEWAFGLSAAARDPVSDYNLLPMGRQQTPFQNFHPLTNNCHDYAKGVLVNLGQ